MIKFIPGGDFVCCPFAFLAVVDVELYSISCPARSYCNFLAIKQYLFDAEYRFLCF